MSRTRVGGLAGCAVATLLLAGCGAVGGEPMVEAAATARAVRLIQDQVDAFNRHDAAAMAELVAEDFVWLAITGDSVAVEVRGRDALETSMRSYFASTPDVRSSIEDVTLAGPYVAVRERASWRGEAGERSQEALGVYEVREGLIQRVWYYPAER